MQITPTSYVQLPLTQVVDQLEIIVNSFSLFPKEINILWTVSGNGIAKEGSMILPPSIIDAWGLDDNIVKNYVLQQLNLSEAVIVIPEVTTTTETTTEPITEQTTTDPSEIV